MSEFEFKGTPGRWEPEGCEIVVGVRRVAEVSDHNGFEEVNDDEFEANISLIAAAPELFEALKDADTELALYADDAVCDHAVNICYCGYWRTVEKIRAVLTRAIGKD